MNLNVFKSFDQFFCKHSLQYRYVRRWVKSLKPQNLQIQTRIRKFKRWYRKDGVRNI